MALGYGNLAHEFWGGHNSAHERVVMGAAMGQQWPLTGTPRSQGSCLLSLLHVGSLTHVV